MSSCLLSWTTYTLPPHPTEWEKCTHLWIIRIHGGKAGVERSRQTRVWRGSALPFDKQGVKVLVNTTGPSTVRGGVYVQEECSSGGVAGTHFLQSLIQSSSSLLLHCASARANYLLRVVKPEARACSQRHNEGLLFKILHVDPGHCADAKVAAMLLNLGGMGLRDTLRVATPAYWASWTDCMPMIFKRHAHVSKFMHELDGAARRAVTGVLGFDPPT